MTLRKTGFPEVAEEALRVLPDPVEEDQIDVFLTRYGITQVPETFVLDRTGRVVLHLPGPVNGSVYRARFERALREAARS